MIYDVDICKAPITAANNWACVPLAQPAGVTGDAPFIWKTSQTDSFSSSRPRSLVLTGTTDMSLCTNTSIPSQYMRYFSVFVQKKKGHIILVQFNTLLREIIPSWWWFSAPSMGLKAALKCNVPSVNQTRQSVAIQPFYRALVVILSSNPIFHGIVVY